MLHEYNEIKDVGQLLLGKLGIKNESEFLHILDDEHTCSSALIGTTPQLQIV